MWSGSIATIPFGWKLCDGNNGTPDLRDKFVMPAGNTYAVDEQGGSEYHNHINNHGSHGHDLPAGSDIAAGANFSHVTSTTVVSTSTNNTTWKPTFYALAYIMHI